MANLEDISSQLMKPPRELASWTFPLSQILEEYFNLLPEPCKIHYGEAALVIQNLVNAYARKVEELYDETRCFSRKIVVSREEEEGKGNSTEQKSKNFRINFNNFELPNEFDTGVGKNIDLKTSEGKILTILHQSFSQLENLRPLLNIEVQDVEGEVVGKKYDYRCNQQLSKYGTLVDEFTAIDFEYYDVGEDNFENSLGDSAIGSCKDFDEHIEMFRKHQTSISNRSPNQNLSHSPLHLIGSPKKEVRSLDSSNNNDNINSDYEYFDVEDFGGNLVQYETDNDDAKNDIACDINQFGNEENNSKNQVEENNSKNQDEENNSKNQDEEKDTCGVANEATPCNEESWDDDHRETSAIDNTEIPNINDNNLEKETEKNLENFSENKSNDPVTVSSPRRSKRLRESNLIDNDSKEDDVDKLKPIPFQDGVPEKLIKKRTEFQLPCHINLLKNTSKRPRITTPRNKNVRSRKSKLEIGKKDNQSSPGDNSQKVLLSPVVVVEKLKNEDLTITTNAEQCAVIKYSPVTTLTMDLLGFQPHEESSQDETPCAFLSNSGYSSPQHSPDPFPSCDDQPETNSFSLESYNTLDSSRNEKFSFFQKSRSSVDEMIKYKIKQIHDELDLHSDSDQKIAKWHEELKPRLLEAERKPPFCIHDYENRIIERLEMCNKKIQFEDIVRDEPACEIARYFSAILQLASSNNLNINGNEDKSNTIELILLE